MASCLRITSYNVCYTKLLRAEASLTQADRLASGSASVLRLRGVLASVLGRTEEAIAILRRALEIDPLSAAAYHSLGLALSYNFV